MIQKVDLSDYDPQGDNKYRLEWFELMSYHKNKVVIYGVGQWWCHLMDWRGCNFYHGRLPKSPVFNNKEEALEWLKFQVKEGVYKDKMELSGHHAGANNCLRGFGKRELGTIFINSLI